MARDLSCVMLAGLCVEIAGRAIGREFEGWAPVVPLDLQDELQRPRSSPGLAICRAILEAHGGRIWFEAGHLSARMPGGET